MSAREPRSMPMVVSPPEPRRRRAQPAALGPIRVAYAIRRLELGGLGALPPFETLLVAD